MNRRARRPDDALLAGVAAELARRLRWNVWAVRLLWVVGLVIQPLAVGVAYLVAAFVVAWLLPSGDAAVADDETLRSDALSERARRIEELERRFRDLERNEEP